MYVCAANMLQLAMTAGVSVATWVQGRDTQDVLEAQVVMRSTAAASAASGMLVVARGRQLAFIDLAAVATAAVTQPGSKQMPTVPPLHLRLLFIRSHSFFTCIHVLSCQA